MKYYRLEVYANDDMANAVCIREIPMKTKTNRAYMTMHTKLIKWANLNYPEAQYISVNHVEYQ